MNLLLFYSILIVILLILIKNIKQETREYLASFSAPIGTPKKDKETMRELQRLGNQGLENARYDNVDTSYLK
jgi:hypothetical protein